MTRFKVGDKVRSLMTVQGMVAGHTYKVVDLAQYGPYVTYLLEANGSGRRVTVRNGHLLLEEAPK